MLFISFNVFAKDYNVVVESDTVSLINLLSKNASVASIANKPLNDIVIWVSLQLLSQPYDVALLDRKTPEYLYISLSKTDCMLFIEEVLASSKLIKEHKLNLKNFTDEIFKLRYHGELSYCNRNHYFKDWAFVNIQKGVISDEALLLTGESFNYPVSSMSHYLSTHNDLHSHNLSCIKTREAFINKNENIGFISLKDLNKYLSKIHSGDIVGIVRTGKGRADSIHHLGIAYVHGGVVSLINASSIENKVIISPTLSGYLAKFKDSQGIVLFRPQ